MRPTAEHLVGAGLVVVAVSPWLEVTSVTDARIAVWAAALAGTVIAVTITRVSGVRVSTELAVSATTLLVFLLLAVVRDPLGFVEVARGIRDGLPRILSTTLPILDVRWAAVPATVVAWTAGGAVTSAIARTRSVALPVGVAFAAFVAGYAVTLGGASGDPSSMGLTAAPVLALLACLLAALRADRAVLAGSWRRSLGRGAAAAGIAVVSVLVAVLVTDRAVYLPEDPVQPRIVPEAGVREPTSPLLVTRSLRADGADQQVGTVTVGEHWSGYVPIAVLQGYDGRIWSIVRDRFDPTGGTLPVELPVGGGTAVRFDLVDIDATGGWLPFVARVAAVEGVSVLHNGGGAFQLAEPAPTASYRLQLSQPSVTLADDGLPDAAAVAAGSATSISVPTSTSDRRPAGERLCRFLSLSRDGAADPHVDGVPCGDRAPHDVGFLRALSETLRDGRAVQEDLVGGDQLESGSEALYDLLELVGTARGQSAVGTPEQFASAYALMADDFGIPVRVVTGFRIEAPDVGEPVPLLGGQAWTWVEVPVEGHGWVVIDPAPSDADVGDQDELEDLTGIEQEPEVIDEERTLVGVDPSQAVGAPPPPEERLTWWVLAVGAVPLLAALTFAQAGARRSIRRRRRQRGDPRDRIVGAWHEALDAVYDAGLHDLEALSGREVADAVAVVAPWLGEPLDELAAAANRAIFSSRPITAGEVARGWEIAGTVRRDLRRAAPRRDRLRALAAPPPPELTGPRDEALVER